MSAIGQPGQMRDHWWWRPGWRIGRRMYAWHVIFNHRTPLHELARAYQEALAPLPGIDPIPIRWLHLTMQGIAFTDEISAQDVTDIARAARKRLTGQPPVPLTVGPALVDPEAIMLEVRPANALDPVRTGVRAAIADVRGVAEVPEADQWTPHISLAYSNNDGPAASFAEVLIAVTHPPVDVTVSAVDLIELSRDAHLYQWIIRAEVQLTG
jgi:hypothetical protein